MASKKTKGYVIASGSAGTEVPSTVTIFASPKCLTVIRQGKSTGQASKEAAAKQAKEDAQKLKEIFRENRAEIRKEVELEIQEGMKNSGKGLPVMVSPKGGVIEPKDKRYVDTMVDMKLRERLSDKLNNSGITQSAVVINETPAEEKYALKMAQLNAVSNKLDKMEFPVAAPGSLSQWFDDMEAMIDALPSISKPPAPVSVVEKGEDGVWKYTGEQTEVDSLYTQHVLEAKKKVCNRINCMVSKVTIILEQMLQEQLARMENTGPFTTAITIISQIPSLTTIIKWATSVIDFLVHTYKMIFSIIMTVLEILEILVVRFPQLINKLMGKVSEFDCDIQANMSINVNSKK